MNPLLSTVVPSPLLQVSDPNGEQPTPEDASPILQVHANTSLPATTLEGSTSGLKATEKVGIPIDVPDSPLISEKEIDAPVDVPVAQVVIESPQRESPTDASIHAIAAGVADPSGQRAAAVLPIGGDNSAAALIAGVESSSAAPINANNESPPLALTAAALFAPMNAGEKSSSAPSSPSIAVQPESNHEEATSSPVLEGRRDSPVMKSYQGNPLILQLSSASVALATVTPSATLVASAVKNLIPQFSCHNPIRVPQL
ncbi:OLC1v1004565C2 [Oldenlandia corymbosa var. corymbosa]|nr:OLC1v1004565C2 [Oldenlandia corymbosa var. corymbosa]